MPHTNKFSSKLCQVSVECTWSYYSQRVDLVAHLLPIQAFVTGLKAAFPDSGFEYLATSLPDTALTPAYTYLDFHQYNTPEWFIERAIQYDTYPRNGTHLFIGECVVLCCLFVIPLLI